MRIVSLYLPLLRDTHVRVPIPILVRTSEDKFEGTHWQTAMERFESRFFPIEALCVASLHYKRTVM
jgi:hypothetical protein